MAESKNAPKKKSPLTQARALIYAAIITLVGGIIVAIITVSFERKEFIFHIPALETAMALESNSTASPTSLTPSPTTSSSPELVETVKAEATGDIVFTETPINSRTPTVSPTPENILFMDNFDNGLSEKWEVISGNYRIILEPNGNGQLTTDDVSWLVVGDSSWTDYKVEFDLVVADCYNADANAVGIRISDISNIIVFWFNACTREWVEVINFSPTRSLQNFALPGTHFSVFAEGDRFGIENGPGFIDSNRTSGKVVLKIIPPTVIDNFKVIAIP